jgi:5-methylthioadenosine/S-adenosylhomocysteine deaminase
LSPDPTTTAGAPAPVDLLILGADLVTLDAEDTVIKDGALAVDAGRIVWRGPAAEAKARYAARDTVDASGQIAMPGMIDAHFHTAQQLLRGKIAELGRFTTPKIPIWKNYYIPFEGMLEPEDVHLSGLVAYTNMIKVGTTCFAEAGGPHPDEMARAADAVGIRGYVALSTVDQNDGIGAVVPPSMLMTTKEAFDRNFALVKRWENHSRVNAWLALRQIIVCSPELITGMADAARDLGVKIHTHLCEGAYEIDYALEKFGKRPTEYLEDLGVLGSHLHCAHSVLLSPDEVDLYQKHRLSACHCAFNNYTIGHPRLVEMWRRGIDIGLGTDGAASWGTLDIFQVAHHARVGQQAVAGTPWHMRTAISSEELLKIATHGGARALGSGADLGHLSVGAKADIILADVADMDQQPIADPLFVAASLVLGRDIKTTIVDGRVVMKNRELLTVDEEAIKATLKQRLPEIMARFDAKVGVGRTR